MDCERFFSLKGDFFQRYNKLDRRYSTMRLALDTFIQRGLSTIVETGCQREKDDWGAGCSTTVFAEVLESFRLGKLISVDITPQFLDIARQLTLHVSHRIEFVLDDAKNFLAWYEGAPIDLLYLDSFDWYPEEPLLTQCQQHQLDEFMLAEDKLHEKTILLLDDNDLPGGGKTKLTKQYIKTRGWKCLIDDYQSLWVKEE